MRFHHTIALALTAALVAPSPPRRAADRPTTAPNPNTAPAGELRDGVLSLNLDAVEAQWHEGAGAAPGSAVLAFAERGRQPTIPGPLVRVPAGTLVRVSVRNTLVRPITFFLPTSPATDDSVIVAAGATGELSVRATTAGSYIYRARDATKLSRAVRVAGAMAGAIVVDSAVAPGTRLVVAMAPALTIGFIVRSSLSSTAITELKGSPVLLTPRWSRAAHEPIAWQTRANTNGLDTLCIENSTAVSPAENTAPPTPTTLIPKRLGAASASAGM